MGENSYADDLSFLKDYAEVVELAGDGGTRVAVVPAFQGRAMTSTLGQDGPSFGWIHTGFIQAGREDPHFNNYGGEDRFWLGPEAGQFGLWFEPGEPFDLAHWKTPPGFSTGSFSVTSREEGSVAMAKRFDLTNYQGTGFSCAVGRAISLIGRDRAAAWLRAEIPEELAWVGFQSRNTLVNSGDRPWTRDGGLLSIWTIGMFKPLPRGRVIVPFRPGPEDRLGAKVTTDYFGPVPQDRCRILDDHLLFACDGQYRSKLGLSPRRARDVLGSYDPDGGVLTLVRFNLPEDAADRPYVNSLWETQDDPYAGDAVNTYNDGPPEPGADQLGPFYELETSSPAAELKPEESISHDHRTFHFTGPFEALNRLARGVLGVDLGEVA